ncbi:uncharacterized protein DS421_11g324190 [Arachis hypogaea]|nr:uncharacterized protein DS421_11g324190 [Arachis hypogaea]
MRMQNENENAVTKPLYPIPLTLTHAAAAPPSLPHSSIPPPSFSSRHTRRQQRWWVCRHSHGAFASPSYNSLLLLLDPSHAGAVCEPSNKATNANELHQHPRNHTQDNSIRHQDQDKARP